MARATKALMVICGNEFVKLDARDRKTGETWLVIVK